MRLKEKKIKFLKKGNSLAYMTYGCIKFICYRKDEDFNLEA